MSQLIHRIVELDQTVTERPLTNDELKTFNMDFAASEAERKETASKEAKRQIAMEKLQALGLTNDDLKALGL